MATLEHMSPPPPFITSTLWTISCSAFEPAAIARGPGLLLSVLFVLVVSPITSPRRLRRTVPLVDVGMTVGGLLVWSVTLSVEA